MFEAIMSIYFYIVNAMNQGTTQREKGESDLMNIMMISSLNTYTKNMSMKMKWQQKQSSGDYGVGKAAYKDQWAKEQAEEAEGPGKPSGSAKELNKIRMKLNAGKRLTSEEMAYLEEHDPETYKKAKSIEMERQAYEQELKRCKTKEDVQRLKMSHAAASLSSVNEIKNNPKIPSGKKLELIVQEHRRFCAIEEETQKFVDSGRYSKLPTEQEQQKAEKEMEEARKAEQNITDKTDDIEVPAEEAARIKKAEEQGETTQPQPYETKTADAGIEAGKPLAVPEGRKAKDVVLESKKSRMEAEVTPEARKVRWAKAQAAYAQAEIGIQTVSAVDIKVEGI